MLGLLVIGLTVFMIYTLVKNALFGKQISSGETFAGPIDLILPVEKNTRFSLVDWEKNLAKLHSTNLHIHVLIEGHHSDIEGWRSLTAQHGYIEVHSFLTRPQGTEGVPWMIKQVAHRLKGEVIMIGDPELVPSESLFGSLAKIVKDKDRVYLTLPQTGKKNILGEAVAILNPTLALASFYGFKKYSRNLSHPFLAISDGWFAMPMHLFQELPLDNMRGESWKLTLMKAFEVKKHNVYIAFGEKHLIRLYPEFFEDYVKTMKDEWAMLWHREDRKSFWFFVGVLFLWSFPIVCFFTHPFWAIGSFFLLALYRFFTKIVFQESWTAVILHPVACLTWITTLFWWIGTSAREIPGTPKKY